MHKRISTWILAVAFLAFAGAALAQNADQNTATPTKNDLKLRVTEPAEGATITGSSIRVAIDYNRQIFGAGQGTHFGEATFPHAIFDVFFDDKLQTSLRSGEANITTIENVTPGSHKITVLAKNISGEVIDRQQINFTSVADTSASTTSSTRMAPPPAPVPAPAQTYESSPSPAPEPPAPATPSTLPQTASSAPRMAVGGLLLVISGLVIARKKR